jgi:hypothetical protein
LIDGFVRIYKVVLPALNALKSIFHPIAFEINFAILKFKSALLSKIFVKSRSYASLLSLLASLGFISNFEASISTFIIVSPLGV